MFVFRNYLKCESKFFLFLCCLVTISPVVRGWSRPSHVCCGRGAITKGRGNACSNPVLVMLAPTSWSISCRRYFPKPVTCGIVSECPCIAGVLRCGTARGFSISYFDADVVQAATWWETAVRMHDLPAAKRRSHVSFGCKAMKSGVGFRVCACRAASCR